uniref:hypothetical protein n=1 Tax=Pedobacter sp. TaxID=1411316 RepID=UPI00159A5A28|nr:hypothetical protein [Pedobacter sp.]QJS06260.1 hypothetical protein [Pedobacter sp.]
MKNLLFLCVAALLFVSCSKDSSDDVSPIAEKKIKVEVDFSGSYQNYQLLFTINSLTKTDGAFVEPLITIPINTQWTQIIPQGNAYNYISDLDNPKFVLESKEAVSSLIFLLSATQIKNTDDLTQTPLSAVVKVYANDKIIETYNYTTLPVGNVTEPLTKTINISEYK